jgi:hypothetical protein
MDPISTIVSALAAGAAAGLKPSAEKFVKDAYNGIKAMVKRKFSSPAVIDMLESEPTSKAKQEVLREELAKTDMSNDRELFERAKELLDLVRKHDPSVFELGDMSAKSVTVGDVNLSEGSGRVSVTRIKANGDFRMGSVTIGHGESASGGQVNSAANAADYRADRIQAGIKFKDVAAGKDILINPKQFFITIGPELYQAFADGPLDPREISEQGPIDVDSLRKQLLRIKRLDTPIKVTVTGTLFPCALLRAGWWDRSQLEIKDNVRWRDDLQKWLFKGFDLWGPSWDFTWEALHTGETTHVIAQLGSGDEADSIPVFLPRNHAVGLEAYFKEGWGGGEVEIKGFLGHRQHFVERHGDVEEFGGLLDYCIWIDEEDKKHRVSARLEETDIYSGYLWRCVAPVSWLEKKEKLALTDVYILWEHTNFRDQDAIRYNLDSLLHKEEYISKMHGPLVLLQKSSSIVPGAVHWDSQQFRDVLFGRRKIV